MAAPLLRAPVPRLGTPRLSVSCHGPWSHVFRVPSRQPRTARLLHISSPRSVQPRSTVAGNGRPPPPPTPSQSSSSSEQNPSPSPPPKGLFSTLNARQKALLLSTCLVGFVSSILLTRWANGTPAPSACWCPSDGPTGRPASLAASDGDAKNRAKTVEEFDRSLVAQEFVGGIGGLRRKLAAKARGGVLEVAVGTGRNLGYYDWTDVVDPGEEGIPERERVERERMRVWRARKRVMEARKEGRGEEVFDEEGAKRPGRVEGEVTSWTGVDISGDMVAVARTRLRDKVPGLRKVMKRVRTEPMPEEGEVVNVLDGRVRLLIADAERPLPGPEEGGKYDTVVQSFGLCSVQDPVKVVANMAAAVKPDTGRIYLLEHGRGAWFRWLDEKLDRTAEDHFKMWGCWWNRDIEGIVDEAARTVPGLEVLEVKRPLLRQMGTAVMVELRVSPDAVGQGQEKR